MAHDVFISCTAADKPVGDAICATLEQNGIRCWIAPRDILPGADWGSSIVEAITKARLMVLVFSAKANASEHIKREVERAVNAGLPIIPIRIEDVMPKGALEYFLSTSQWLSAFAAPLETYLGSFVGYVRLAMEGKTRSIPNIADEEPSAMSSSVEGAVHRYLPIEPLRIIELAAEELDMGSSEELLRSLILRALAAGLEKKIAAKNLVIEVAKHWPGRLFTPDEFGDKRKKAACSKYAWQAGGKEIWCYLDDTHLSNGRRGFAVFEGGICWRGLKKPRSLTFLYSGMAKSSPGDFRKSFLRIYRGIYIGKIFIRIKTQDTLRWHVARLLCLLNWLESTTY